MAKAKQPQSQVFKFSPAVPCAVLVADYHHCGKPATVASGYRNEDGTWVLMPKCQECAEAMAKLYEVKGDNP